MQSQTSSMSGRYERSRSGCKSCKKLKIKCDQQKPRCQNCIKRNIEDCDYSLTLHWGGRPYKDITKKVARLPNTRIIDGVITVDQPPKGKVVKSVSKFKQMISMSKKSPYQHKLEYDSKDVEMQPLFNPIFVEPSLVTSERLEVLAPENNNLSTVPSVSLRGLHLPSPLPTILSSSTYYMELFEFYLRETCHLLVPVPREIYRKNPFYVVLPQIAMQSPTLLYLLLAFGANHRNMMLAQSASSSDSLIDPTTIASSSFFDITDPLEILEQYFPLEKFSLPVNNTSVTDNLLSRAFKELVQKLKDRKERTSDGTLATVMMLAAYDIFFSDRRRKWRAHVYGARNLMMERLKGSTEQTLTIADVIDESDPRIFLARWFSYVDIIGSLSSTNRVITTEKLSSLRYEFKHYKDFGNKRKISLSDIEYSTGMEPKVLSLLADTSWVISEKERQSDSDSGTDDISSELLLQALELDYKITKHLQESELERDNVYDLFFRDRVLTNNSDPDNYGGYRILRATNMIFGLTGSLQLKRRVLNMPLESVVIKDLLLRITSIVEDYIPLASSSTSCVIFCLFCCGCDLLDDSMIKYRPVYMERIESLNQRGVSSAGVAKQLMHQCWAQRKFWWNLLKENNLDITFAI